MITEKEIIDFAKLNNTPSYIFDIDVLRKRIADIRNIVGDKIALCYAMKANPHILPRIIDMVDRVEVCSPGELEICKYQNIDSDKIVYSGVNKTKKDVQDALNYNAGVYTAESIHQVEILEKAVEEVTNKDKIDETENNNLKIPVLLRLNGGSQFGMSKEDIFYVLDHKEDYKHLQFVGLHYFVGTQRTKQKDRNKELLMLKDLFLEIRNKYGLAFERLEYGPGLSVPYFTKDDFTDTLLPLKETMKQLNDMANVCDVTIEMGRFFVFDCGTYLSKVMDIKENEGTNYCIIDGGMNHVTYYGQVMGMKEPIIRHIKSTSQNTKDYENEKNICVDTNELSNVRNEGGHKNEDINDTMEKEYALCGSLCTTADVLVRSINFKNLEMGDILAFENIGAYSVTEGIYLFLSRTMPRIYFIYTEDGNRKYELTRDFIDSWQFNTIQK